MKQTTTTAIGLIAALLCGSSAVAQGVVSVDERTKTIVGAPVAPYGIDPIITGSTGAILPNSPSLGGGSLEDICDRDCQFERLDKWRDILADQ